jgi:aryl-alcohol dehydrogenase-like predicted oxidoreductase
MSHATPFGTSRYAERSKKAGLHSSSYRTLGRSGLTVSSFGYGSYRIDDHTLPHIQSLELALKMGINLIDTSTNYTDGGSERCVGKALHGLIDRGVIKRDEVVVVSKVGYVQGTNLKLASAKERAGAPYPEMTKYMDGCWHCIHPDFIRDQIATSLERTRLEKIDIYLLHNPEYFLMHAHNEGQTDIAKVRQDFYQRIQSAFLCLEQLVKDGKISHYGISSNTLGNPSSAHDATSLSHFWNVAEAVSLKLFNEKGKHHFSVVQFPLNLFESGPVLTKNTGEQEGHTLLEEALAKNLGTLVNRPLNAFRNSQLLRLAHIKAPELSLPTVAELAQKVMELEQKFVSQFGLDLQSKNNDVQADSIFRWGEELGRFQLAGISSQQWKEVERYTIRPHLDHLLKQLDEYFKDQSESHWSDWRVRYLTSMEELLESVGYSLAKQTEETSLQISKRLNPVLPEELHGESLSKKALAAVANTVGVHCVLNGMRMPQYVNEAVEVMTWDKFTVTTKTYGFTFGGQE